MDEIVRKQRNSVRRGGGVEVSGDGLFTKTGGTIYGYTEGNANSNIVKDTNGNVVSDMGHAAYVAKSPVKLRKTTAGPAVNLDSSVAGTAGGWEN